ncbi:hypothetical protein IQ07DRAFT_582973 [Pyrenochaeta sp. DS3sAY3a]|nr:hypothetical protein IQ07DRAFT_582973 [Pyrenochaeta sp. DS3sAY3a]
MGSLRSIWACGVAAICPRWTSSPDSVRSHDAGYDGEWKCCHCCHSSCPECEDPCHEESEYERFTKGLKSCNAMFALEIIRRRLSLGDFLDAIPGSVSVAGRLEMAVGLLKISLFLMLAVSMFVANGYAQQRWQPEVNRNTDTRSTALSTLNFGPFITPHDNFGLSINTVAYICAPPMLNNFNASRAYEDWDYLPLYETPPASETSPEYPWNQDAPLHASAIDPDGDNGSVPRTIQFMADGTTWSSVCHTMTVRYRPGIIAAVASVIVFSISIAGLKRWDPRVISRDSIPIAILQSLAIWISHGGSLETNILTILPLCIVIPVLVRLVSCPARVHQTRYMSTEDCDCGFATERKRGMQGSFNCDDEKSSWIPEPEAPRAPRAPERERESDALRESILRAMP